MDGRTADRGNPQNRTRNWSGQGWMLGAICPSSSKARQNGLLDLSQQNKKAPFAEGPERIFQCLKEKISQGYHAVNVSGEIVLARYAEGTIWPEKAPDVGGSSPETGGMSTALAQNLPGTFPRAETAHSRIIWLVPVDAAKLTVKVLFNPRQSRAMFQTGRPTSKTGWRRSLPEHIQSHPVIRSIFTFWAEISGSIPIPGTFGPTWPLDTGRMHRGPEAFLPWSR